ncbi:hypothetical protein [Cellulomonas fimi]|uniref:Uncharacterized protein n=1 Tax=Cellulomonas fimi TaxID=1708 RepID=A0A7Y0M165_CELFI|nr:hypothetical protein [Cellulomonas fimi]NMR21163.1 hypothetical protein [Cellulomonas fimi]
MGLQEIAAELYALTPAEFTAARNRSAKDARQAGDKELAARVAALPKPSTAAWAVNQLVRGRGAAVAQLLTVGGELREAQQSMSGADLRELNRRQHQLLVAVRREAETLAAEQGRPLTETIAQRVQATLHAAMADPDAADAVRTGLLVADLESTGLAPVELEGAVAVPDAAPVVDPTARAQSGRSQAGGAEAGRAGAGPAKAGPATTERQKAADERAERERREQAERERREAAAAAVESKAAELAAARDAAEGALTEVTARRDAIEAEIAELEARLAELKVEARQAVRLETKARSTRDSTTRRAASAAQEAATLRARVRVSPGSAAPGAGAASRRRR